MSESPPDRELSAVAELGAQFEALALGGPRHRRLLTPMIGGWAAGTVCLLIAAAVFTAPGRAIAEWVGDLVGIGEVGGPATLDEHIRSIPPSGEALVVETGATPDGDRFEIVGYRSDETGIGEATCVSVEFPDLEKPLRAEGFCYRAGHGQGPTEQGVRIANVSFPAGQTADELPYAAISGEANAATRKVELTYLERSGTQRAAEATVAVLGGKVGDQIGIPHPTVFWVVFADDFGRQALHAGGPIRAVAYGAGGEQIAQNTLELPGGRHPSSPEIISGSAMENACKDPDARDRCLHLKEILRTLRARESLKRTEEKRRPG